MQIGVYSLMVVTSTILMLYVSQHAIGHIHDFLSNHAIRRKGIRSAEKGLVTVACIVMYGMAAAHLASLSHGFSNLMTTPGRHSSKLRTVSTICLEVALVRSANILTASSKQAATSRCKLA